MDITDVNELPLIGVAVSIIYRLDGKLHHTIQVIWAPSIDEAEATYIDTVRNQGAEIVSYLSVDFDVE